MTVDATDMSTPVTRGELKEELATFELRFEQKIDQKLDKLEQRLEQRLEQKFDQKLELWGGALLARIAGSEQRMLALFAELQQWMLASEQRLLAELARHCGAIQESLSKQVSVVDEKYNDLPGRVRKLEAKVFRPRRR